MEPMQRVEIVRMCKTDVWIEDDFFGGRQVVVQHEGCDPFTYASFNYDYRYTSNAGTLSAATELAMQLGATTPVARKSRAPEALNKEKIKRQIEALQDLLLKLNKQNGT